MDISSVVKYCLYDVRRRILAIAVVNRKERVDVLFDLVLALDSEVAKTIVSAFDLDHVGQLA